MLSPVDQMILDIAVGARAPPGRDLVSIRRHIAAAGFDPHARFPPDKRVIGLARSGGAVVHAGDRIPTAELHFLRHVVAQGEWPPGTTPTQYVRYLRDLAGHSRAGILMSIIPPFGWHVAIVGRTGGWRGPRGFDWMLVEDRVNGRHWATGFQLRDGLRFFIPRMHTRWLRLPT